MALLDRLDESDRRLEEAKQYSNPYKREFDLDKAINLLEQALVLKPGNRQCNQILDQIRRIKLRSESKLYMLILAVYGYATMETDEVGLFVDAKVGQGIVRNGDHVKVKGRHKVLYVDSPKGFGVPGETVGLVIEDLTTNDIKEGDAVEGV